jgi:hypothetical protein
MADDFGRVNPVPAYLLPRDGREEPYHGRHSRKHQAHNPDRSELDSDVTGEEETGVPTSKNHIDLRI